MSRQAYKRIKFTSPIIELIGLMSEICDDYESQGLVLTARQLFYRLVSTDVIPNTVKSYKRITSVINDAKMAGLLDWDMFEDRTRSFKQYRTYRNPAQILNEASSAYFKDLWEGQSHRVFCTIEKDALYGVLERVCLGNCVPLLAARGYPSSTVLRKFVEDEVRGIGAERIVMLHFGDHDPSGIDMTRDLQERIDVFAAEYGIEISISRLALNFDQIRELNPPPNPAKMTDSRVGGYIAKFGKKSWELDAVEPRRLVAIAREAIFDGVDMKKWNRNLKLMKAEKLKIQEFAATFV